MVLPQRLVRLNLVQSMMHKSIEMGRAFYHQRIPTETNAPFLTMEGIIHLHLRYPEHINFYWVAWYQQSISDFQSR
jgi:hypothetical protein